VQSSFWLAATFGAPLILQFGFRGGQGWILAQNSRHLASTAAFIADHASPLFARVAQTLRRSFGGTLSLHV
jgi:hypothetical protein